MKLQILLIILFTTVTFSQNHNCLSYEPKIERIKGKIERITFAGPPNYESVKKGDKTEIYWILKLSNAVCVNNINNDELNVPETNLKEIQLVLKINQYKKYKRFIWKNVIVKGTLFHAFTAHHKTRVLLEVEDIIYKE